MIMNFNSMNKVNDSITHYINNAQKGRLLLVCVCSNLDNAKSEKSQFCCFILLKYVVVWKKIGCKCCSLF